MDKSEMDYFPKELPQMCKDCQKSDPNLGKACEFYEECLRNYHPEPEKPRPTRILSAEEVLNERLNQFSHDCLCQRSMKCVAMDHNYRVYACSPEGCGRIFLEDVSGADPGTYYQPEQNDNRGKL
jgi:hypothetical protein